MNLIFFLILLVCLDNYCEVTPNAIGQPHWPKGLSSWPKRIRWILDLAVSIWNLHHYLPLTKEVDKACFQLFQIPTQVILKFENMGHLTKKEVSSVNIIWHGVSVVWVSILCHLQMLRFLGNFPSSSFWQNWELSCVNR